MIEQNILLKDYSFYRIGGPARYFMEVESKEDIVSGIAEWQRIKATLEPEAQKHFVIGGATNILFDDKGYNGLVIRNRIRTISDTSETQIEFGSGLPVSQAVQYAIEKSLSGLEWAGGLPGTIGGAIRGNAGAFGKETKDTAINVKSLNLATLEARDFDNSACQFGYRNSYFKSPEGKDEFLISGTFTFTKGNKDTIAEESRSHVTYRKNHQPLEYPSAGSTFKNVDCRLAPPELVGQCQNVIKNDPFPVIPVAYLLSEAGLKGTRVGNAQIAEKHPNFIINLGDAKAEDVRALIDIAQQKVADKFHVQIEPEIIILGY